MKKYYLFEKNASGGNDYRHYSLEDLKKNFDYDYLKNDEDFQLFAFLEKYNEALNNIDDNVDSINDFLENYVNNEDGIHYHDYYVEEV